MATISENLIALNEAKANIKSAIESKGQDLAGVPFTQYADKISAISGGGSESDEMVIGMIDGLTPFDLIIPNGATRVRNYAFMDCENLRSVVMSDTVKDLWRNTFQSCKNLMSVVMSKNLETIGEYSFQMCVNLTNVVLPNSLKSIGNGTFQNCRGLTEITIPNSVTSLGTNMFSGCTGLITATIGNGLKTMPANMFSSCTNLTSVTTGSSVTTVNAGVFSGCTNLLKVVFSSQLQAVPKLSNVNAFNNVNANLKIYVPDALYDTWITSTNWTNYQSQIYKLSEMPNE